MSKIRRALAHTELDDFDVGEPARDAALPALAITKPVP
jgi:hypothetical protein